MILLIVLLFTFIFIGIKAFSIPGTFGSIINSIIPMAGGSGLARGFKKNERLLLDPAKVKQIVTETMALISLVNI